MQVAGEVAGIVMVAASATLGVRMCTRVWREPAYADMIAQGGRVLPFGYATSRGSTRALVPVDAAVGFLGAGALATAALPPGPVDKASPLFVFAGVCFGLGMAFITVMTSIIWFNRPLSLVPPHMRGEEGLVTAWWRSRSLPPEQRRAAARARRAWPAPGHPPPPSSRSGS